MAKFDELGKRMKSFYEERTRLFLPRRTYTVIRIDGKAFHTYTKGLERPFDAGLIDDMDQTAIYLCSKIQGAKLAYVQSDEISIILTDFDKIGTDAWFDGNIQKIASISASMATSKFNQLRMVRIIKDFNDIKDFKLAEFDSRVFTIPSYTEVENYLIWRMQDCTRNSILSVGQYLFSHKDLENKNTNIVQEMCFSKGVNWNDYPDKLKRGRLIFKDNYVKGEVIRTKWLSVGMPMLTKDKTLINGTIPKIY